MRGYYGNEIERLSNSLKFDITDILEARGKKELPFEYRLSVVYDGVTTEFISRFGEIYESRFGERFGETYESLNGGEIKVESVEDLANMYSCLCSEVGLPVMDYRVEYCDFNSDGSLDIATNAVIGDDGLYAFYYDAYMSEDGNVYLSKVFSDESVECIDGETELAKNLKVFLEWEKKKHENMLRDSK